MTSQGVGLINEKVKKEAAVLDAVRLQMSKVLIGQHVMMDCKQGNVFLQRFHSMSRMWNVPARQMHLHQARNAKCQKNLHALMAHQTINAAKQNRYIADLAF